MDTLLLRRAGEADLPVITDVLQKSYGQFKEILTSEFWAKLENGLQQVDVLLAQAECFLCFVDDKAAGVIFLVPSGNPTPIYPENWAYIRLLGVDPAQRGKGIGRLLAEHVIKVARENGEAFLGLHTSTVMPVARQLYENLGFTIVKQLEPMLGQEYWLYIKELD